jgi:hypothetical protein
MISVTKISAGHIGLVYCAKVCFGSMPACDGYRWIFNLATCYAGLNGRIRPEADGRISLHDVLSRNFDPDLVQVENGALAGIWRRAMIHYSYLSSGR